MNHSGGLLSLALVLLLFPTVAAETPPQDLRLVGDHWTAWDPPASFPEGAEVYTIVVADTLWDLAARFLGDPYLWPQIWERNQYILDAHWIYPGDPLLLGIQVTSPEEAGLVTEAIPDEPAAKLSKAAPYPLVQLGHADDIYCSGFIGELEETFPYRVSGSEYEFLGPSFDLGRRAKIQAQFGVVGTIKYGLSLGDIVYLAAGREDNLKPGDTFTSVAPGAVVRHPLTEERLGRFYGYLGQVRILSVQESSSIGEIVQSCHFMTIGAALKPFVAEPIPSRRKKPMRPPSYPASKDVLEGSAVIVHAKDGLVVLGKDHVIFIDQGKNKGLIAGDILTVYRVTRGGLPSLLLGEIALLSVREETSAAKIVESRYPIYIGDIAALN